MDTFTHNGFKRVHEKDLFIQRTKHGLSGMTGTSSILSTSSASDSCAAALTKFKIKIYFLFGGDVTNYIYPLLCQFLSLTFGYPFLLYPGNIIFERSLINANHVL